MTRKFALRTLVLAVTAAHGGIALAEDYPAKPITVLHGLAVGGQTDMSVRLMADALGRKLNVPVVVQARPGAAQTIAVTALVNSQPDGYTLGHYYQGAFSTVPLLQKVSYTMDDLEPIIAWQMSAQVLVVRDDSPLKSLADLVEASKANPETPLQFGHQGKGSVNFLAPTVFAKLAGITLSEVQYKGDTDTVNAVLGGHIPLGSITEVAAGPLIEAGRIRALVTYAKRRLPNIPDVPTFEEQGYEVPLQVPVGVLFAPKGTPAPVVKKLHDSVREIIEDEKMQQDFANMKQALHYMDGQAVRDMIENERRAYYPILKEAGLTQ